jgi:deferrochelatase/peroxidase EfeB
MPPNFPSSAPFNPVAHQPFLELIQGNILKSHGRSHVRLLFFQVSFARSDVRALWRAALEAKLVTSAWAQRDDTTAFKSGADGSRPFYGLLLTKEFFWQIDPDNFPPETGGAFKTGAFGRMGERNTKNWQPIYKSDPHGVWLLAHENADELPAMEARVRKLLRAHGATAARKVENGFRWHDAADRTALREPFGFRDGISESVFLQPDGPAPKHVQFGLDQVVIRDGPHAGGSFLVLQKLEQNVQAFRGFEAKMKAAFAAAGQPLPARDPGALLVGRERDGTPLVDGATQLTNNFDFDRPADADGARCPFHAHIRKANPRTDTLPGEQLLARQFARRSMIYDEHGQLPAFAAPGYPEGDGITRDVGLLFMAYMRDVQLQFEHMRLTWFEGRDFPFPGEDMPDPVLSGHGAPGQSWSWHKRDVAVPGLPDFVTSRGAVFCYAPSLDWLWQF